MLPISMRRPWDPSAYLPVSTYSPEPKEQWASCTSSRPSLSRPTPRSEVRTDELAAQLVVSIPGLPAFEMRPIKRPNPHTVSAQLPFEAPISSSSQYDASINEIHRRLCALSTPSELQFSRAEVCMTAVSAQLLAHQTNNSQSSLALKNPEAAFRRPIPPLKKLCNDSYTSKVVLLPTSLEDFAHELQTRDSRPYLGGSSPHSRYGHAGTISGDQTIESQIFTGCRETPSKTVTLQQRDRLNRTEGSIFELAATEATAEQRTSWPVTRPPHPPEVGSQTSPLEVASLGDHSRRMKTQSWQPPRNLTWPTDHAAGKATQLETNCRSSSRTTGSPGHGNTPYCTTAWNMQLGRVQDDWQPHFTFTRGSSDMVCNTCQSRIPTHGFRIRCKSSLWGASERLMARCHKASLSQNGNAQFGCVFCPVDQLTFRSRNEFWAHLETHSAITFEKDADVVEVILNY